MLFFFVVFCIIRQNYYTLSPFSRYLLEIFLLIFFSYSTHPARCNTKLFRVRFNTGFSLTSSSNCREFMVSTLPSLTVKQILSQPTLVPCGGVTLHPPTLHLLGGSTLHPPITTQRPPSLHPPHS